MLQQRTQQLIVFFNNLTLITASFLIAQSE